MQGYVLLFMLFVLGPFQMVSAQVDAARNDTTMRYYARLANSKSESDKELLQGLLYNRLNSKEESDWLTARRFFGQLKKSQTADSIAKIIRIKFPTGVMARGEEVNNIYNEKNAAQKEKAYKAWVNKFPPEKYGRDRIQYDYARSNVARAFASAGNINKALTYTKMIETKAWKGEGSMGVMNELLKKGHYKEAKALIQEAIDNAYKYKTIWKDSAGAGFAALGYPTYLLMYANILYEGKDYAEALVYQQKAYEAADSSRRISMNGLFAKIYMALGRDKEAFEKLDESVRHGMATPAMKEALMKLYTKVKGSEGFEEYMQKVQAALIQKIRQNLAKQIINEPAPQFTLTDLNGKSVSLADLKGKTVVVDFWATWCGPCIKSFPAMQTAVNRYKDDPNVRFLFIHTWERDSNPVENARKFIEEKKYSFEVLMDLKDAETGNNKIVESFKVQGIPTKFVIDRNGNIRFKFTGFAGGDDAAVEEIAAMIEMAQK